MRYYLKLIVNLAGPPPPPSQQPNFPHSQPNFAQSQPDFPPKQLNFALRPPNFPLHHPNFPLNQPSFAQIQPNFFNPPDFPRGQQQHFSPANQQLPGLPHFLDQSQFSTPSQTDFPTSTNSGFPASSHQHFSPSNHQHYAQSGQASRPPSNHQHFPNQQHSPTSSQTSPPIRKQSPTRPVQSLQSANNRRVTISTGTLPDAARQHDEAMQIKSSLADEAASSVIDAREVHNAIKQVHETLNEIRYQMVAMNEKVDQNIYALRDETFAMHKENNGGIERVIKMLNYS